MKVLEKFSLIVLTFLLIASCSNSSGGKKVEAKEAEDIENIASVQGFDIDLENSIVNWTGKKPTGEHDGTVMIKEGKINVKDGQVVGGAFVIEMNSITNSDLEDEEMKTKLVGHLKSQDFFDVEKYAEAKFEITGVENAEKDAAEVAMGDILINSLVTGNLAMKDSVKSISFEVRIEVTEDQIIVESNDFIINRTDWGVNYGSKKIFDNLKDKFINDEMILSLKVVANK